MKYIKYSLVFLVLLFFILHYAPVMLENAIAGHERKTFPNIRAEVQAFHNSLFIADLHADSLLWKRDLSKNTYRGYLDFPRMEKGNVSLQVMTVVSHVPRGQNSHTNSGKTDVLGALAALQMQPLDTWTSPFARLLFQAKKLEKYTEKNKSWSFTKSKEDLERNLQRGNISLILGVEGVHLFETWEQLDQAIQLGVKVFGLTHFFDNKYSGSLHGVEKDGITEKGHELIRRVHAAGGIIDLAHASHQATKDYIKTYKRPAINSHTGVIGYCNHVRNLPDDLAKEFSRHGGILGIGFWSQVTCGKEVSDIVDLILYTVNLVGIDHVALGSDYDGAVQAPFSVDQMAILTQALLDAGMSEAHIRKIMGENVKRFFLASF